MHDYLKSGRQAIRLLYFLIIGFAFTRSITDLFNVDGHFAVPDYDKVVLFVVFLSYITRFFLGAYRALSYDIDVETRRVKIAGDAISFFF